MAFRYAPAREAVYDSTGAVGAGYKLNFYITGTTTRLDTYSDKGRTSANANPVVADSAGRFGDIFLQPRDYKAVLTDASDVAIYTADPVHAQALNNFNASAAPTASDDVDQGYDEGSLWVDRTNNTAYICVDSSNGAADWNQIDATTITGTADEITITGGTTVGLADDPIIPGNERVKMPGGTTAQRPSSPVFGDLRRNTSNNLLEWYTSTVWSELVRHNLAASAAPSAATDDTTLDYRPGSIWVDTTNDKAYICADATDGAAVWNALGSPARIIVRNKQSTNVGGGTATTGSRQTRIMNDEHYDSDGIASVASNQLTVNKTADWIFRGAAVFHAVNQFQLHVKNVDSPEDVPCAVGYAAAGASEVHWAAFTGKISTVAGEKIEVQYECAGTQATTGQGFTANFGEDTVYMHLELEEIL